jgi:hypothetical protein
MAADRNPPLPKARPPKSAAASAGAGSSAMLLLAAPGKSSAPNALQVRFCRDRFPRPVSKEYREIRVRIQVHCTSGPCHLP